MFVFIRPAVYPEYYMSRISFFLRDEKSVFAYNGL